LTHHNDNRRTGANLQEADSSLKCNGAMTRV
jgi:hypothetical protein